LAKLVGMEGLTLGFSELNQLNKVEKAGSMAGNNFVGKSKETY